MGSRWPSFRAGAVPSDPADATDTRRRSRIRGRPCTRPEPTRSDAPARPVRRAPLNPLRLARLASLTAAALVACGFTFSNAYRSPRNSEREVRRSTTLIILHTTEAPAKSALNKLSERGEIHYVVDTDGIVYRIIDHRRIAFHCGRSMWNGRTQVDDFAIGIEVVGYHNKPMTAKQTIALAALIGEIQSIYKIPDERVLPHSMVAYGAPNRFHKRSHRGRKRCGMQFATWAVRQKLNLTAQPRFDPDVRARRLVNADPYLAQVLFGSAVQQDQALAKYKAEENTVIGPGRTAWDIARDAYNSTNTVYVFPDGSRRTGNGIRAWAAIPTGTRVLLNEACADEEPVESFKTIGTDGKTAADFAGEETRLETTYYIYPAGGSFSGAELSAEAIAALPRGTRVLVGYKRIGPIRAGTRVYEICGAKWKAPDTYFLYSHGLLKPGSEMDESKIPMGLYLFYKN